MFFSVLVPVYNTSQYLDTCLKSIIAQSFSDFEVVLLDDGSTDNSGLICDRYAEKYDFIRVIHKDNEGLMMTRRRGFQEAKGQYFICVDSDDYLYDKYALEKIHKLITEKDCDLVIYNYIYGEGGGKPEREREIFDTPDGYVFDSENKVDIYDKLLTTNYMNNIWIKCPSRKIVDIDTDYSVWKNEICRAEDLFQTYPIISNANRIGYVKDPLYYYRWDSNSISNKTKFEYYNAFRRIFLRENDYLTKWEISYVTREKALHRRVTLVMEVIVSNYFRCKETHKKEEWKSFIRNLSEDSFFINLFDGCNRKRVLIYYRLLYFFVKKQFISLTAFIIRITSFVSRTKKIILRRT